MTLPHDVREGFELQPLVRTPDPLDLFLYSAAVWLPHRIHYDLRHTTQAEGHPGLVVQGPLQGVYLMQLLTANFGAGTEVDTFVFRHQVPVYVDQTLSCGGRVVAHDAAAGTMTCELWTELEDGRRATVAAATLRLPASPAAN